MKYYTFWVCVCSFSYPACKAHESSSVACLDLHYSSTLSHKRHYFRENVFEYKVCVLIFSTCFAWNISHSEKKWARYFHKYILVFMCSTRYSCYILRKLEFSSRIFEKFSNIKFHEIPSSGSRVVPYGRTDWWTKGRTERLMDERTDGQTYRHVAANCRFSEFCESV